MAKIIIQILLICIIVASLNVIYQVFYTYPYHNGQPVLFIPPLNFPVFVIISFIIGVISSKYIMKINWLWALFLAFLMALTFNYSATFIQNKYTYLYDHYYKRSSFTDLIHLKEYGKQIDNRLTLGKELKNIGVKVTSIEGGYTDKGYLVSDPDTYQKKLYYVNDDLYIIFDWDKRKITAQEDQESIRKEIAEKYENIPGGSDIRFSHSAKVFSILDEKGMVLRYFIIEPTEEDKFKFTED